MAKRRDGGRRSTSSWANELETLETCVIQPERSRPLWKWDAICAFLLIAVAILTPFEAGFLETETLSFMGVFNIITNVFFMIDMFMQFFIAYPIETRYGPRWEYRKSMIALRYLKGWFAIDLPQPQFVTGNEAQTDKMVVSSIDSHTFWDVCKRHASKILSSSSFKGFETSCSLEGQYYTIGLHITWLWTGAFADHSHAQELNGWDGWRRNLETKRKRSVLSTLKSPSESLDWWFPTQDFHLVRECPSLQGYWSSCDWHEARMVSGLPSNILVVWEGC